MLPKKDELKILWPFYASSFSWALLGLFIPFAVLYYSSIGFSSTQIGIILGIIPLGTILFEIPTGAIADLYGRKFSVISGFILGGIMTFLIPFTANYYTILILSFLFGAALTLTSGSSEAWVVDLLKGKNKEKLIKNYFLHNYSFINLGFLISGIIGALSVQYFGLKSVIFLSATGLFLTSAFLTIPQEIFKKKNITASRSIHSIYNQTINSLKYTFSHKIMFILLLISLTMALIYSFSSQLTWTPLLINAGLPNHHIGYLWSLLTLSGIICPLLIKKFVKNHPKFLYSLAIITLFYFLIFIPSKYLLVFISLYLFKFIIVDSQYPVWNGYIQRFMPSKKRATITSTFGMSSSLIGAIILPISGILIDTIGPKFTIITGGVFTIPLIVLYKKLLKKL